MPTFKMSLTQEQCKHPIHLFIVHLYISDIIVSFKEPAAMGELFTFLNSPKNKETHVSYLGPKFYTGPLTRSLKEDLSFNS